MVVDRFGYPGGNMGPGMMGGAPCLEIPDSVYKGGRLPGIPGEFVDRCEVLCRLPVKSSDDPENVFETLSVSWATPKEVWSSGTLSSW